jgi:hypothetical protein
MVQWSEFLAADSEGRARSPALPDFLGLEQDPLSLLEELLE